MLSALSRIVRLIWDLILRCGLVLRSRESLEAEKQFLRRPIANELLLKPGLQVSPRTPQAIIACDFCVAVTNTFRVLYVLVVIEHHSRRLIHFA